MMAFAYSPSDNDPPEIYVRWTWVKEMGIPWEKASIDDDDVPHLARLISIKNEADDVKSRAKSKAAGHGKPRVGV